MDEFVDLLRYPGDADKLEKQHVPRVERTESQDPEGYLYQLRDCKIFAHAELGGHGVLYDLQLPASLAPESIDDFLAVMSKIFEDYHYDYTFLRGKLEEIKSK